MNITLLTSVLSTVGSIFLVISYVPQIITLYKVKDSKSQSVSFWVILLISLLALTLNMIINQNPITVLIPQFLNILFALVILGQVIYYKKRGRK